ncbi:MAG TPA: hypothetical protein VMS37_06665 [Verrucomicrobiae bacterium]|nr:hypothetical protein [Verrucomicrobiae bacterium]
MTPVNSLTASYIQSVLGSALQGTASSASSTLSPASQADSSSLSPFAQMLTTLQQLQQSDPAKYQQVTQQIAGNLQSASQTAQANGNTTAATQLAQLSADFSDASKSGQLPKIQDLAQAMGAMHHGHGHHHHRAEASSDSNASSTSDTSSSTSPLSQLLSAFQTNGAGNSDTLNPLDIIMNTLSQSGVQSA